MNLYAMASAARAAAMELALASNEQKNDCLYRIASLLEEQQDAVLRANQIDVKQAQEAGLFAAMIDRMQVTPSRLKEMQEGIAKVAMLPDPIGVSLSEQTRPNGLQIKKVSVPLGVIGMIYESRPNVTVDAAVLCIKAGNAVLLRGGKETLQTNIALAAIIQQALRECQLDPNCVQLFTDPDRKYVTELMQMHGLVDVLIPRGGAGLIRNVVENSKVPVLETGTGNNHVYVDSSANLEMALAIVKNAKTSRISVCNAIESLIVHEAVAPNFLPSLLTSLQSYPMKYYGCAKTKQIISCEDANDDLYAAEFLDYALSIKVVSQLQEAIDHINRFGTKHSECIVSETPAHIEAFLNQVDAACVYVNASTRFSDGFEFGLGCEIGISTQKIHARGPMGLEALTTYKYLVSGNGQTR